MVITMMTAIMTQKTQKAVVLVDIMTMMIGSLWGLVIPVAKTIGKRRRTLVPGSTPGKPPPIEDTMTFYGCLMECANNQELVKEFDRLRGTNLSLRGSPIEIEIDKSTGRLDHDLKLFVDFVWECVWRRLNEHD